MVKAVLFGAVNKLKRIIILAVILSMMMVAGCSKSPGNTASSTPPTTTSKPATTTSVPPASSVPTTGTTSTIVPPVSTTGTVIPTSPGTTTSTAQPGVYEVYLYWEMVYSPNPLTVPVGSTVKFILVNGPDPSHPLGFSPALVYAVSTSGKDTVYTYTFTKAGLYTYYCTEHATSGTVLVQ